MCKNISWLREVINSSWKPFDCRRPICPGPRWRSVCIKFLKSLPWSTMRRCLHGMILATWLVTVVSHRCPPRKTPFGWHYSMFLGVLVSRTIDPNLNSAVQTRNWQIAWLKADNRAMSAQETNGSAIKNRLWRVTACMIYERPDVRESVAVNVYAFGLVNSLTLYQLYCCRRERKWKPQI